jgi:hypothetical protein
LVFVLCSKTEEKTDEKPIRCETLNDMKDHSNPIATGKNLGNCGICFSEWKDVPKCDSSTIVPGFFKDLLQ